MVRVEGAEGNHLRFERIESGYSAGMTRCEVVEGRTPTLAVTEDARWLVLFKEDAEVDRAPLALVPGEVTTVER